MPIVYLPAVPMRYDAHNDERIPALDVSGASDFGDMKTLLNLDRPLLPSEMPSAINEICTKLKPIQSDDFIVAVGDPVLIAAAVSYGIHKNGVAKMLRWNRISKSYQPIEVRLS